MAYATASDVTVRWGKSEVDPDLTALIEVRLADVERDIRRRITDLDDRAEDEDYAADLVRVESEAVLRLVRNPDGYLSETDGEYTYMLRQDISSGKLEVLPGEWEILGSSSYGMFLIVPNPVMPT